MSLASKPGVIVSTVDYYNSQCNIELSKERLSRCECLSIMLSNISVSPGRTDRESGGGMEELPSSLGRKQPPGGSTQDQGQWH